MPHSSLLLRVDVAVVIALIVVGVCNGPPNDYGQHVTFYLTSPVYTGSNRFCKNPTQWVLAIFYYGTPREIKLTSIPVYCILILKAT